MKVLQVVAGISHESSGTSAVIPKLCESLVVAGCSVELHAMNPLTSKPMPGVSVVGHDLSAFWPSRLGASFSMKRALRKECVNADVIHTNGLWMFPNVYPEWARHGTRCKFVLQPHGTLSTWSLKRSRFIKNIFGTFFGQFAALRKADMLVATCEDEYEEIRRFGLHNPVAVIPNGVDIPEKCAAKATRRRMYFLSRIHPKKNIEQLLRTWAKLEARYSDWDLCIVGPDVDNPYADQMKQLSKDLDCKRVYFLGELTGDEKLRFVSESECIVLPTFSENFGMVVAEALAAGTAAISSKGAPWSGLDAHKCGLWVDLDENKFLAAVEQILSLPRDELVSMGLNGRKWMSEEFSWPCIGQQMRSCYEWLVDGGPKPDCIKLD